MCFMPIVKPFVGALVFSAIGVVCLGLVTGVAGRRGMLARPGHLIPLLVYREICVCSVLGFVFPTGFMRLITLN
jgi:hypothetical protein